LSTAAPPAVWPARLSLSVTGAAQVAMPDSVSSQVKPTVTAPVYQPLSPSVPAVTVPWMLGAVLSSLTSTLAVPLLSALSDASPSTHRLAVSSDTRTSGVTLPGLMPEPVSSARKATVTSSRFHPLTLASGESTGVTTGAMLSHFRLAVLATSALPARSTAQYRSVASPSPSSGTGTETVWPWATCSAPPLTL
jgi:hypothetical protein